MKCLFFLLAAIAGAVLAEDLKLLILHNNDMHARFEETSPRSGVCNTAKKIKNCVGGFARVAHVIREARKAAKDGKGPPVLFLNAGDTYTGTAWFSVHRHKIVTEFLNILEPDAISFGNHEFDDKVKGLIPFINGSEFPIVAANLDFSEEPELKRSKVTKSVVLNINGREIGVIGYLTPETKQISAPEKVIFEDEVAAINKESEKLDKQGVKIIIALGHSGYEVDRKIARECPLVDLVIGGHTNTFLWNGPKPDLEDPEGPYPTVEHQRNGKKVPVVQAYAYTKYMGQLNIVFNDKGDAIEYHGNPLLLNTSIPQESDLLDVLEKYRPAVEELDKEVVGKTKVFLDGSVESCRYKECNFGNLITDAYVAYYSSVYGGSYWTDSPVAIINGGAVRNSIESKATDGSVTRGELLGVMPFQDHLLSMSINGSDLLKTLEIGVRSNGETSRGELLQVSGIHYTFDMSKPVGERIVQVKVRCGQCSVPVYEPLVSHKAYRIITTGFLDAGGDGHTIIRDNGYRKVTLDLNDIDTVSWYMNKTSPIYPEEDERIIVLGKPEPYYKHTSGGTSLTTTVFTGLLMVVLHLLQYMINDIE